MDAPHRIAVEQRLSEAASALAKGRFERALRAYEALAELEPAVASHRLRAADCFAKLGRNKEAVAGYCVAARLYEASKREPQAHAAWQLAHALDPADPTAASGLLAVERGVAARAVLPLPARPLPFVPREIDTGTTELMARSDALLGELSLKQGIVLQESTPELEEKADRIEALEAELAATRRHDLHRELEADVARARRFHLELAVLVLNTTPQNAASALTAAEETLRMTDTVARLADGRLAVVALGVNARGARTIAGKLRAAMAELVPPIDLTVGVAPLHDQPSEPPMSGRELIAAADAALERALEAGHHVSTATQQWLEVEEGR